LRQTVAFTTDLGLRRRLRKRSAATGASVRRWCIDYRSRARGIQPNRNPREIHVGCAGRWAASALPNHVVQRAPDRRRVRLRSVRGPPMPLESGPPSRHLDPYPPHRRRPPGLCDHTSRLTFYLDHTAQICCGLRIMPMREVVADVLSPGGGFSLSQDADLFQGELC
jgi:hypothetical protein